MPQQNNANQSLNTTRKQTSTTTPKSKVSSDKLHNVIKSPGKTGAPAGSIRKSHSTVQQPSNVDLATLQQQEVEVLESIIGPDFTKVEGDVGQSAWNKNAGGPSSCSFQIILRPDTDSLKSTVYATARFRLPIRYPLLPPIITVLTGNNAFKGLSGNHLKELQDLLTAKAKEMAGGEEMIWDLVTTAQEYISGNNLEKFAGPNRSLEEEKRLREVEKQEEIRRKAKEEFQQRGKEEEERANKIAQLIREQSERNTAMMKQEKERKRGASVLSPSDTQLIDYLGEQSNVEKNIARRTEFFMDPIEKDGRVTHQVVVGPLIKKTALSSTFLVESINGPSQTWAMETFHIKSPYYNSSNGKRALEEIEWELDKLRKLHCENLINILASALITQSGNSNEANEEGQLTEKRILIVQENYTGPSLATLLSHCIQLPWARVRLYFLDLIGALDALHNRNLLHRDVSLDNVVLESKSGNIAIAKLARAGYGKRLDDMNMVNPLIAGETVVQSDQSTSLPIGWEAPEIAMEKKETAANHTRKRDVWQLGIVIMQMLFGPQIIGSFATPEDFFRAGEQDPTLLAGIGSHVIMLLKAIMEKSTRRRPTVAELRGRLEEIIRYEEEDQGSTTLHDPDEKEIMNGNKANASAPRRAFMRTISEREDAFRPGSFWQLGRDRAAAGNASRYENDFEELQLLGKGAYGSVFKARNRLDGRDYAIKKIRLSASAENDEKTLREITALSRLSHQNIVRYVTCWIQVQDEDLTGTETTTETVSTSTNQFNTRDFALPGLNDDFLSVGHDAFSSRNASHIRFGNSDSDDSDNGSNVVGKQKVKSDDGDSSDDDDEDDESTSSSEESNLEEEHMTKSMVHQSFSLPVQSATPTRPRWLFIQMEFVGFQTLREVIDRGLSIEESWRLFRQMIEALAHVASLGIIHRDLKPSNILIFGEDDEVSVKAGKSRKADGIGNGSSVGDIKIGDFGLATTTTTTNQQSNEGAPMTLLPPFGHVGASGGQGEESVEQTTEIGTNLYIAPEVLKAGTSRYDHKVDIYAAGIVFFEMLASQRVYKTGMERIQILRDLRSKEVRFPKGWNEQQMPAQTKILKRMLSHNPNERPSPLELLKSDLLPPKMEDEYIAECMRLLSMPDSTYNLQLMDSLFGKRETFEEGEARDFTFDTGSNEGPGLDNRFIGIASKYLRALFHRNGAVELEAPLLIPPNELYANQEQKPVELLDKTGKVVQLPFDLVVPFARMVARVEHPRFKRYAIAPVYRPNLLAGGQPRSVIEVDFDIVASEKTPAAEAEVLALVDEMLDEVPGLDGSEWVIQISHGAILDLLMERVPAQLRDQVIATIGKIAGSTSKTAATQARVRLAALGLPRSITDELDNANISDDIEVVCEKLQRLIAVDLRPRLTRAMDEIRKVIESAQQFGVQRRFLFTPLLVSNPTFYRDNVYFVVVRGRGKRRDVLASGGRYDALLKRFASPTLARAPAHAVGVQIALGRIAVALAKHQETKMMNAINYGTNEERTLFGPFTPRRCDVYVASAPGLLQTRMEICRDLWSANISADLAYEQVLEEDSPELLASTCKAEGIWFLVIARSRGSVVKVKSIVTKSEHEVHRWELTSWLAERIQRLRSQIVGTDSNSSAALMNGAMMNGNEFTTGMGGNLSGMGGTMGGGSASNTLPAAVVMQQYAGEVEVILPERQHDKRRADKHGYNDTKRGRKQAHLAPLQENAARQVARMIDEMMSNGGNIGNSMSTTSMTRIPILAVDIGSCNSFMFNNVGNVAMGGGGSGFVNAQMANVPGTSSAQSPSAFASSQWSTSQSNLYTNQGGGHSGGGTGGGGSGIISAGGGGTGGTGAGGSGFINNGPMGIDAFHRLSAAAMARVDDGLWKLFMDTLSTSDEREYGKQLRRRIKDFNGRAWLVSIRSEGAIALI